MLRKNLKNIAIGVAIGIVILLIAGRLYMNTWLTDYINRHLADVDGYSGSIESVDIHLYRGAYQINNLKLDKQEGKIAVPFLDLERIDFSLEWGALIRGRIVSEVHLTNAIVNFAVSESGETNQTGVEIDWTKHIKELIPIDINRVVIESGKISYRDFSSEPEVNIYMDAMQGEITNLRNVENPDEALPSTFEMQGKSIGGGIMRVSGKANILKAFPDVDMEAELENVSLPAINNFARAYALIDFEGGVFFLYSKLVIKDGAVSGYIKPIANDIKIINLNRSQNPVKLLWETVASVVVEVFTNQRKDQFATQIELTGNVNEVETKPLTALVGIFRNAFVKAFEKKVN